MSNEPTAMMRRTGFFSRVETFVISPLNPPGLKDFFFYSLGLRTILSAGVPIIKAFELMGASTQNLRLRKASRNISQAIAAGINLQDAVRSQHDFTHCFIEIFLSGARTGNFVYGLDILVKHYNWMLEMRTRIMRLIWYPIANLILGALILMFRDLIVSSAGRSFIWSAAFPIIRQYLVYPAMVVFFAFLLSRILRDPRVRPYTDWALGKIPLIRKFYDRYAKAIFFRLFAAFMEAGRHLGESYSEALKGMNNYYLVKRMAVAAKYIEAGERLSFAFERTKVFDVQALGMINTGEISGAAPELFNKMAEYYQAEIYNILPGYVQGFYPALIIITALAFFTSPLFLYIGMFLTLAMLLWIV
ncbi:MAG TPA: type II secretion system F family protein [Candidatus Sumerlaeota bacterium]|nr:type II secretion system F family protein [Candidatus Sumerlaeota bacterium]HRR30964.1 type II secretion system F family protein [Candidatus Sumerlaeia bacterium]HON49128.1 type II secretion system F family protein [Candidatus Sumerlaeota bacterium]HOR64265.1 type II secretion system F family protein [Candidatus Sumerlaeota bacterium]HPL73281.1 type II secretion system F family protein [Candidatus Sumerlaeota bacterium]